ncbi:hypothetical protein MPER_13874, partial [Moniliophthora perniciosa FA553]
GELKQCHYSGKKQLVKRHIENVHLRINTKEEPHICNYPGCEKRYNDPARLHRHK